jgi:hypothetical protein
MPKKPTARDDFHRRSISISPQHAGYLLARDTDAVLRLADDGVLQVVGEGRDRRIVLSSVWAYQESHVV